MRTRRVWTCVLAAALALSAAPIAAAPEDGGEARFRALYKELVETNTTWSAGDCTRHTGREGHEIRLECVQNAIDQAKHAALSMMDKHKIYSEVPWFWSDQYDLKLQIAGLARPTDTLVRRGDPAARKFAVFHLRDGAVAAVEAVNAAPEYMIGKKLVASAATIAAETLADMSIPMKQMA